MSCVTLLTDFGREDAALAAVEGIILRELPGEKTVDIAHNIKPYHLQQASYLLASSFRHFPEGSIHLILFDIFYDNQPVLTLTQQEGHYFLAPDNGIIPLTFRREVADVYSCLQMTDEGSTQKWMNAAIEAINKLRNKSWAESYTTYSLKNTPLHLKPKMTNSILECQVIYIDRFENVVLNITKNEFENFRVGRDFSIKFMRDEQINTISKNYNSVREGQKLCRFNDAGYLEIAINRGEAAGLFGLRTAIDKQYIYNTIKIEFE